MKEFLEITKTLKGLKKIEVKKSKDKNLQYDPYFYERKKHLDKIRDDMKNGIGVLSQEEFDLEMDKFFKKLEKKVKS